MPGAVTDTALDATRYPASVTVRLASGAEVSAQLTEREATLIVSTFLAWASADVAARAEPRDAA